MGVYHICGCGHVKSARIERAVIIGATASWIAIQGLGNNHVVLYIFWR